MNSLKENSNDSRRIFEFGEFSFDASNKILWRSSETVQLAPKACELLGILIEHAPQVISKEELMNQIWSDSFVEEANLTHHISALRKTLGEDKNGRKFIETIPRKGYRFVAEIRKETISENAEFVFNERASFYAIEKTIVEADDLPVRTETISSSKNIAPMQALKPNRRISRSILIAATGLIILILGTAAFFIYRNLSAVKNTIPPEISFKRLTPDVYAFDAAGSPDGKSFAYVLYENGVQQSVWQKNLTTGEQSQILPVVEAKKSNYYFLRYSPDGIWLYFYLGVYDAESGKKSGIYRIPAAGGTPQIIAAQSPQTDYGISPDGSEITFIRDNGIRVVIAKTDGSGEERVIAERDGQKQGFSTDFGSVPAWSPDGKHLVVSGGRREQGHEIDELIDIEVATGNTKLFPIPPTLTFTQLEWLADSSGLVGLGYEGSGLPHQIKFISYPDGKISSVTNDDSDYIVLRLSKDNRSIFASKNLGARNLWIAPVADFSQRKQITVGSTARHGNYGIALAKNGKIIYTSTQSGSLDLWEMNEDGSGRKQLTVNAGKYNANPEITADGRYIVFESNRSGTQQVWRMDADGRNPIQLSVGTTDVASLDCLSPDGKWVYYTSFRAENQEYKSFKFSIESGQNEADDGKFDYSNRIFSPDGKYLFYRIYGKDKVPDKLHLIETASGRKLKLPEIFSPLNAEWSGDSKSIYFTDSDTHLAKFDITDPKVQTVFDTSPNSITAFEITPDNQKIVFSMGNFSNEVVLIENFLGGEVNRK